MKEIHLKILFVLLVAPKEITGRRSAEMQTSTAYIPNGNSGLLLDRKEDYTTLGQDVIREFVRRLRQPHMMAEEV